MQRQPSFTGYETLPLGSAGEAPLLDPSTEIEQSAEQAKAEAEQAQLDGIVKILEEFTEESNSKLEFRLRQGGLLQ